MCGIYVLSVGVQPHHRLGHYEVSKPAIDYSKKLQAAKGHQAEEP